MSDCNTPGDVDDGSETPDRFLLDVMLGKLATYLRMCGYDTVYALDRGIENDDAVRRLARTEGRTLLTRDEELAAATEDARLLTERDVIDQLRELRDLGLDLSLPDVPRRCSVCNGRLEPADADGAPEHVPDDVQLYRCEVCGKLFWDGSHCEDVRATLAEL